MLIHRLQVQMSRLNEYASRVRLNHSLPVGTIDLAIGDAAEVFARVSGVFPFSRGYPVQTFDVGRDNIYKALSDAGYFDFDSSPLIGELADKWEIETLALAAWDKKTDKIAMRPRHHWTQKMRSLL
jgi:hypothetical protein